MIRKKVLLAEDDDDDKFFFIHFLEDRSDISILSCVENGIEVFDILDGLADPADFPDVILLDQNMPKMNGMDTLRQLKNDPKLSAIPVFIYSTYADQNLTNKCMALGAHAVSQKPTNKQGYNTMIDSFLRIIDQQK